MKRTLLTLALVAAAGGAGAQTLTTSLAVGATVARLPVSSGAVTRPPVVPPKSVTAPSQASLPAAPDAQGSAHAVNKIEADGYKKVQGMMRNADGSWSGQALRGGAVVDVHVDARGNVFTR